MRIKNIILFAFTFLMYLKLNAQIDIEWQKALGGSDLDLPGFSIQQTNDGGYITTGESWSVDGDVSNNHGLSDFWVFKLDMSGGLEWQKSLGGGSWDVANSIQQTIDAGYIIAGYSYSNTGDVTENHGYADYWIVKLDPTGNIEWQKSLGGSNSDQATFAQQTTDGGYILIGNSKSNDGDVTINYGEEDIWIVKLNSLGNIEWQKSLGGSNSDQAPSIQQTTDGGYILIGYSKSNDGDVTINYGEEDMWVVKLNSIGNIEWQKSLGGSSKDYGVDIKQTQDGGYILVGSTESEDGDVTENLGDKDCWVAKLDILGNIEWQKSLGGSSEDFGYGILQTQEGDYILTGGTESVDGDVTENYGNTDCWVVKLDVLGDIEWQKSLGGSNFDTGRDIYETSDMGYITLGFSWSNDYDVTENHGGGDFWVVKLGAETASVEDEDIHLISIYPNPTKNVIYFSEQIQKLEIFDMSGKIVKKQNTISSKLDISELPTGTYVVSGITETGKNFRNKIIRD